MKLLTVENNKLPPLAWRAILSNSSDSVEVLHGVGVAVSDTFFFEGAWAGDFQVRRL